MYNHNKKILLGLMNILCFRISWCQIGIEDLMMADARRSQSSSNSMAWDPILRDFGQLKIQNMDLKDKPFNGGYNIHEIPPTENGDPLTVEVSVSLRNILEIDEHKQLLTIETTLRLYWVDERLSVKHLLENSSMDYILLHPKVAKLIWFPDIYIDFAKDLRIPTYMTPPASLRIYRNSTIRYATQVNYDVACPMTFFKYPYDTQVCEVKYESYGHTIEKMKVVWKQGLDKSKVTDNNSISLAQFEYEVLFEENYFEEIASGVYPGVIMKIILKRNINYHLLQTYLPSGIFVVVAWLSLFLPPQSIPGRITMAMTTLLTLAAMFGAVRQSTPRVSYVSALDIWMCTCIIFVFFALLEYVIMLSLMTKCGKLKKKRSSKEKEEEEDQSSTFLRRPHPCEAPSATQGINKVFYSVESPCHLVMNKQEPKAVTKKRGFSGLCHKKRRVSSLKGRMSDSPNSSNSNNINSNVDMNITPFIKFERSCSFIMAVLFISFNGFYWSWLLKEPKGEPQFQN
ncbi:glutamate-gated chloride channel alpha [Lepeophtheirus salmonis]|uniref:glutamate-gated chloride channel alpha n=1 Tax=Lepeophtheirus salmonis TaxID=72036 RepID=UPI001AE11DF6|nr:glutamate-gated chloride channel alpha-like [Lepeophtheirus salmonis]